MIYLCNPMYITGVVGFVDPPFVDPKMVQNISKYVFFDFIVSLNAFNKDMYPVNLG